MSIIGSGLHDLSLLMHEHPTAAPVDIERRFGLRIGALGEALLRMVTALPAGLSIQDAGGRLLFVDRVLAELFERPAASLTGGSFDNELAVSELEELRRAEQLALRRGGPQSAFHVFDIGGRRCRLAVTRQVLRPIDENAPPLLCCIWQLLEPVGRQAQGGPAPAEPRGRPGAGGDENHQVPFAAAQPAPREAPVGQTLFDDQLRRELDLSSREHREFALVAIAIDMPDPALAPRDDALRRQIRQTVDHLLRGNIRTMDASFSIAADRFVLILSGVGLATAHSRVEALRRQCAEQRLSVGDKVHRFSVSIGVASYPHTARDRREIVRAAEAALEVAQRRGGNHVALASIPFETR